MYLSRVELDPIRRSTMTALAAPQKFHGAVESAFSGERRRRLWRLDRLGEKLYLLLLSEEMPDLSGVVEQFGTGATPESRNYDPLLARITPGSRWQFRLAANPTKSCKDAQKPAARGTVAAHCTTQYQKQWLLDRAAKHGFALTEDSFTVTRVQWHHFAKCGTRPVSLLAVTYEGVLQVTDPEAFRNLLCQGMGRGKAYGLGLLTVMRGG
jgi:CRISPR system Cascade subunit CasE